LESKQSKYRLTTSGRIAARYEVKAHPVIFPMSLFYCCLGWKGSATVLAAAGKLVAVRETMEKDEAMALFARTYFGETDSGILSPSPGKSS